MKRNKQLLFQKLLFFYRILATIFLQSNPIFKIIKPQINTMETIGHGAQATVYKVTQQSGHTIVIKQRLPKLYRHPQLDKKLNQSRVKSQAKIMQKLHKKNIKVPQLYKMDLETYKIEMEWIEGTKMKDYINDGGLSQGELDNLIEKLGQLIYRVHELGVIHGDLTTSNMIYKDGQIYLIDFGLSYVKNSIQDRAVDLYVLQRAFISTHPQLQKQFDKVLIAYNQESVLKRLEVVRQRGRKKVAFG